MGRTRDKYLYVNFPTPLQTAFSAKLILKKPDDSAMGKGELPHEYGILPFFPFTTGELSALVIL